MFDAEVQRRQMHPPGVRSKLICLIGACLLKILMETYSTSHFVCDGKQQWRSVSRVVPLIAPRAFPSSSCPNYFIVTSMSEGIGHRMHAIAIAMSFAMDAEAGIILDDHIFDSVRAKGGNYPWLRRFFNLYSFPTTKELGIRIVGGSATNFMSPYGQIEGRLSLHAYDAVEQAKVGCFQAFVMPTGFPEGCPTLDRKGLTYCLLVGVPGAYARVHPILSTLYAAGSYTKKPLHLFHARTNDQKNSVTVAWHVRNDDAMLFAGQRLFWTNLVAAVTYTLRGVSSEHYVFSQHRITHDDPDFGFLHAIKGWTWTPLPGVAEDQCLAHMVGADVLVHSGSSFSMAAALAAGPRQVAFFPLPKESKVEWDAPWQTYWINGSVPVHADGTVAENDVQHARAKLFSNLR